MTVRQCVVNRLVAMGMFENQANEVVDATVTNLDKTKGEPIHWNYGGHHYSDSMYATIMVVVKQEALKWIEKNKPQAWYKPMFQ